MDTFNTLRRRATDLVQNLPQNLPTLPKRPAASSNNSMKGTWEKIDIPPLPRSSHSVSIVGTSAYIFGGELKPREPVDNDMHVITLPSSGAGADYYTVVARPANASSSEESKDKGKELLNAPDPKAQSKPRSEDEDSSGEEDSDEEESSSEDESDDDDDDSGEDDSDEDEEEKPNKTKTPTTKDKGKSVTFASPLKTAVPVPRVGHAAAVIGSRIFMFGGRGGSDMNALDEAGRVWVFDTRSHSWSALDPKEGARVPPPRSYHAAAAIDRPREFFDTDPSSPGKPVTTWMDWAKGDRDRIGIPQDPVVGIVSEEAMDEEELGYGTFFIHGGCLSGPGERTGDLWAFDVRSKTWQEFPSAPGMPRGGAAMTVSKSRIYRFGGFNGKTQEGAQLDVLEIGVSTFEDGRTPQPGEAIVTARGGWHSIYAAPSNDIDSASGLERYPPSRSVCSLTTVTVGGGREYLVLMLGEAEASAAGHSGAGKFHDDIWAFQVPPLGMSSASVGEAFRTAFGAKSNEGKWFSVEAGAYDEEDEDQEEDIGPGARGWLASAAMGELEENGVLVWGGLDETNQRLGDGYIFRLE